jgi:hypothetical protein
MAKIFTHGKGHFSHSGSIRSILENHFQEQMMSSPTSRNHFREWVHHLLPKTISRAGDGIVCSRKWCRGAGDDITSS